MPGPPPPPGSAHMQRTRPSDRVRWVRWVGEGLWVSVPSAVGGRVRGALIGYTRWRPERIHRAVERLRPVFWWDGADRLGLGLGLVQAAPIAADPGKTRTRPGGRVVRERGMGMERDVWVRIRERRGGGSDARLSLFTRGARNRIHRSPAITVNNRGALRRDGPRACTVGSGTAQGGGCQRPARGS
jgi:hypothetical protein